MEGTRVAKTCTSKRLIIKKDAQLGQIETSVTLCKVCVLYRLKLHTFTHLNLYVCLNTISGRLRILVQDASSADILSSLHVSKDTLRLKYIYHLLYPLMF